jgi:hypothetical protein
MVEMLVDGKQTNFQSSGNDSQASSYASDGQIGGGTAEKLERDSRFQIPDSRFAGRKREGLDLAIANPAGFRQNRNRQRSNSPTGVPPSDPLALLLRVIRCCCVHVLRRMRHPDWLAAEQQTASGKALEVSVGSPAPGRWSKRPP